MVLHWSVSERTMNAVTEYFETRKNKTVYSPTPDPADQTWDSAVIIKILLPFFGRGLFMEEKWNAILYNKNRKVLQVHLESNGSVTELGDLYDPAALPLILQHKLDLETINKWLTKRRMPAKREGLEQVKQLYGSFENQRNLFALTDQYWFKRSQKDSWEKLNFFTNSYESYVGEALFMPWTGDRKKLQKPTPDITTNGVLRKIWIQADDKTSYLIKAGSETFLQEPLSEVLAALILRQMDIIPFVEYDLCIYGYRICSKCKNFVTSNTEFIPAQSLYAKRPRLSTDTKYDHLIKMCDYYGIKDANTYLDRMILADLIIGNQDRHLGNFGILRNVETGSFIGFAPLFDFGCAFYEYSGKTPSRERIVFADQEQRVQKAYQSLMAERIPKDLKPILQLIDTYPSLTVKQKNAVKKGIIERFKRFLHFE